MRVFACAEHAVRKRIVEAGQVRREVKTLATTTGAVYELFDWLQFHGVEHVVMESTRVYWKPVWHVMEEGFEPTPANAKHPSRARR